MAIKLVLLEQLRPSSEFDPHRVPHTTFQTNLLMKNSAFDLTSRTNEEVAGLMRVPTADDIGVRNCYNNVSV